MGDRKTELELPDFCDNYEEKDFIKKIKLPDLSYFKPKNKDDDCPYMKLWIFVGKELDLEINEMYVGGLIVSKYIDDILHGYMKKWAKRQMPLLTGDFLKKAISWHHLNISPSIFYDSKFGPTWSKKNYIYVRKTIKANKEG